MDSASSQPIFDFHVWARVNAALQGYANALDSADMDDLLAHFDENAKWFYTPSAMHQGHDQIRAFFDERLGKFARTSHNVCPPVLRSGSVPGEIESTAYFTAEHLLVDGSRYRVCGRYVDQLRLTNDRALITQRSVVAHVTEGTDRIYNMLPRKSAAAG